MNQKPSLYESNCAQLGVKLGETAGYNLAVASLIQRFRAACQAQRAIFAAQAPEVPEWYTAPAMPQVDGSALIDEAAANVAIMKHRLISWRFHYADAMLAELVKG